MRSVLAVLGIAAALSAAFFLFSTTTGDDAVSLASEGASGGKSGGAPITSTAVLFGMLAAVGMVGVKLGRRDL